VLNLNNDNGDGDGDGDGHLLLRFNVPARYQSSAMLSSPMSQLLFDGRYNILCGVPAFGYASCSTTPYNCITLKTGDSETIVLQTQLSYEKSLTGLTFRVTVLDSADIQMAG
jgi:hypothetical protein